MLNAASVDAPQSSRMGPPIETGAALPKEAGTYLKAGNLYEHDECRFQVSEPRSVTTAPTSNLLAQTDPAIPDSDGNTPLCLAAQSGNLAQAQQLIHRGADVHHINLDGDNALTLAAAGGHLTFIEWLDSHFWQSVDHENYYGETALTLAARHGHQPVVQWLVSRDASVTHLNDQLKDALAEAVANGHLVLAQWLSSQNTDLKRVYPDGNNLFLHAVCAGHQSVAQWLEDSGVDSQQINESGDSAITLAARHGHYQLLAWLLRKNAAGIDQINRNGDSPVLIAARHGHGEAVKILVQNGADIKLVNYVGSDVLTLAAASSESLALWLCGVGINIHQIDHCGNNAFMLAVQSGFFQLMQTLEQLGINIHQVNHDNDNAFTLAARQGSLPWCQWLAGKGVNIHQVNCMHHNAVTLAALTGSLPLLQWLCTEGVDCRQIPKVSMYKGGCHDISWLSYSFNAAILAASAGHFPAAQWLMQQGLSIHQRDYQGRNAIILAVGLGKLDAVKWFAAQGVMLDVFPVELPGCFKLFRNNAMSLAAHLGHLHIMQWLHQNGVSLDHDRSADLLKVAARRGDLPMTRWLCRQGAHLNNTDSIALGEAVSCGHLRLSQWLVGQGAEDLPDIYDNDALMLATMGGQNAIFRWLIGSKCLDDRQANDLLLRALRSGQRSLAVWLCLKACESISGVDNKNCNALMLAAKHGFLWLTQWLSAQTVDINQTNGLGCTALMLAAANGHLPVVKWLYLAKNANLHQKEHNNADALHLAVNKGQTETANWLIGQGMVLDHQFTEFTVRWTSNRDNVGLLRCLMRQQAPPKFLVNTLLYAARHGDVLALACCLTPVIGLPSTNIPYEGCSKQASAGGSLAALEFLCQGGNHDVYNTKKSSLVTAAKFGNLHVIQWFSKRSGLSEEEKNDCLLAASAQDNLHIVKWLYRQGADIRKKNSSGYNSLSNAIWCGSTPTVEWFCQQGEDLHQFEENGDGALSLAIRACEPQMARWLFRHGFRLTRKDLDSVCADRTKRMLGMIFKMMSRILRANLFRAASADQKSRLLGLLPLDSENVNPSEDADARFARFNQYSDKTLEHKCLVALASVIGQQSSNLEAGLKAVDSLPMSFDCKFNLRELVSINYHNR